MHDIITIGSSLLDIFVTSPHFEIQHSGDGVKLCQMYGEKIEADSFLFRTGGGGSNTAVGFARAGFCVGVVSELGKDVPSTLLIDEFHKEIVSTNFLVQEKKEETGGSVILVGKDGGRSVLVHRGASALLDPQDIPRRALKTAEWLHLSSISGRLPALQTIAEVVQQNHLHVSWNPGGKELELLLSGNFHLEDLPCQVLLLNKSEWQSIQPLQEKVKSLIPEIIVTDGGEGGEYFLKGQVARFAAQKETVVDETGAGDAFGVGYIVGRLSGKEPETAIKWGIKNASSVIQQFGAKPGLLTKEKLAAV